MRARAYFKAGPGKDATLRALEFRKNNYGPPDAPPIVLRWQAGVYAVAPGDDTFEELAAQAEMDQLFLTLLRRFEDQGRNVSDKPSPTYAPAVFVSEPETKAAKATKAKLVEAMARLFAGKRIKVRAFGPPSKGRSRILENDQFPTPSNANIIPFPASNPPPNPPPNLGPNGVPTASNGVCYQPPIPPAPLEGANGAVLGGDCPAPTNGDAPPVAPLAGTPHALSEASYEVLGAAPSGTRCALCGGGSPRPMRIRRGGAVSIWHEACAAKYMAALAEPVPADNDIDPPAV